MTNKLLKDIIKLLKACKNPETLDTIYQLLLRLPLSENGMNKYTETR